MIDIPVIVRRVIHAMLPSWVFVSKHPPKGRVVAVHNSPGSPYIEPRLSYDVLVDHGLTGGQRTYENVIPANKYPEEYDVYGAESNTDALISWDGDNPSFTINWAAAVTDPCEGNP